MKLCSISCHFPGPHGDLRPPVRTLLTTRNDGRLRNFPDEDREEDLGATRR